jgi:hypothetical protein
MIVRLAFRSLAVRPIRTVVLACGFGLGIGVMAALLGVGDVILEQARSPQLEGGGDMVVSGAFGEIDNGRFVLSAVRGLRQDSNRPWTVAASPSRRTSLYLMGPEGATPVVARGGVPSLERAVGDREAAGVAAWVDSPRDARWATLDAGDLLRSIDRFHQPPDVPEFAASWAEWLYFNGRSADGRVRFYLTFMVGPEIQSRPGFRSAGVRLQLDRDGQTTNYSSRDEVDAHRILDVAPDLDIGASRVRLEGSQYRIAIRLVSESDGSELVGTLSLDPDAGRSLPPAVIRGARGWLSGYVVPVLSGRLTGSLQNVGTSRTSTSGTSGTRGTIVIAGEGYHDHNWGFWRDVRWQWGQVASGGLSFIYGRVFPPAEVADPDRIPGFLGVLDHNGLVGVATNVQIAEQGLNRSSALAAPQTITVTARSSTVDVSMTFSTDRAVRTAMAMTGGATDFIQMGGTYRVEGRAGGRTIDVTARGAAETFRPRK